MTDDLLYRRGNFNGSVDQLICAALMDELDASVALSPGFRWGTTLLPGSAITMEDLMAQVAITYPAVTLTEMNGAFLKRVGRIGAIGQVFNFEYDFVAKFPEDKDLAAIAPTAI